MLRDLLTRSLQFQSISGNEGEFTRFVAAWAIEQGFTVDCWQAEESAMADHPLATARHLPLIGRPTAVITLPADPKLAPGRSLLFNAHADVVAAPDADRWTHPPFAGEVHDGKFFGRGACDVKGPMVSALGAMLELRRLHPEGLAGAVSLELIPGEEDCVGLGTLTSVVRGHRADGVIVLEPTENQPRSASRGGCRFDVACLGKSVHGTVKWLGTDAIATLRIVLDLLEEIESEWNDRTADPLFDGYPIARPVTVDSVNAGQWQGMVADRATCGGYLELLPGDEPDSKKREFVEALHQKLRDRGQDLRSVEIKFSETYNGYRIDSTHPFAETAVEVMRRHNRAVSGSSLAGFNSGCEAGLRAGMSQTPTLVWGPGSLSQAHAIDEFVEWKSVVAVSEMFVEFAARWCADGLIRRK